MGAEAGGTFDWLFSREGACLPLASFLEGSLGANVGASLKTAVCWSLEEVDTDRDRPVSSDGRCPYSGSFPFVAESATGPAGW